VVIDAELAAGCWLLAEEEEIFGGRWIEGWGE
jgi:hypothetical protein